MSVCLCLLPSFPSSLRIPTEQQPLSHNPSGNNCPIEACGRMTWGAGSRKCEMGTLIFGKGRHGFTPKGTPL
uniref:Uncharacterized protein n=1 Tax=Chromera velia CCMP2878 TaxID=1169474 RepID=A0A0G4I1P8_9ALVE|eukprot:Cvel_1682.t1-p1 / transcript=Cvel_1682.t1 / gene=Cvel_1682 / organism=Chromera_velia_CCMP2878 / gene_product=hypothetical protein / transcript_product=hypothetical protein / location=Cvel_scaffold60:109405-109987(-) / protein_length=71 / sequence_SO=supercontig / SO=protein_coding / is_pseudo=false